MKLNFDAFATVLNTLYNGYVTNKLTAPEFITQLKTVNAQYIADFARMGYKDAGGVNADADTAATTATNFINSFADKFGADLEAGYPVDKGAWRTFMYANEGHRLAYVLGQQQAMQERGAKSWRRVLHPESSQSGPCQLCIDDSMLVHPISEPFKLLHPGDVCTVQETVAYYAEPAEFAVGQPIAEMPVPQRFPNALAWIKEVLGALKQNYKTVVRRVLAHPSQPDTGTVTTVTPVEDWTDEALALAIGLGIATQKKRRR